jgi:hypothetical protein
MEPFNTKKKPKERKNGGSEGLDEYSPRIRSLSSYDLNNYIKNLTNPNFLGSIHLSKEAMSPYNVPVENLLKGELELKLTKSLKNSMFNPITITLILIAIVFNIAWIIFMYL